MIMMMGEHLPLKDIISRSETNKRWQTRKQQQLNQQLKQEEKWHKYEGTGLHVGVEAILGNILTEYDEKQQQKMKQVSPVIKPGGIEGIVNNGDYRNQNNRTEGNGRCDREMNRWFKEWGAGDGNREKRIVRDRGDGEGVANIMVKRL